LNDTHGILELPFCRRTIHALNAASNIPLIKRTSDIRKLANITQYTSALSNTAR
jgi:hypothetical protein